jgi:antitoxin MazE
MDIRRREGEGMQTKVRRWGNSLGLRIPRSFAAELQVEDGSAVDLTVAEGEIRVRPLRARRYSLESLVEGITDGNRHGEVPVAPAVGREVW